MTTSAPSRNIDSRLLRRTLQTNGVLTSISGVILIAGTLPLTSFFGLSTPLTLIVLGVVFLLVAVSLFRTAVRQPIDRRAGLLFAIIDIVWVAGSIILLTGNWIPFSSGGKWVIGLVAIVVALFAGLELYGVWLVRQAEQR